MAKKEFFSASKIRNKCVTDHDGEEYLLYKLLKEKLRSSKTMVCVSKAGCNEYKLENLIAKVYITPSDRTSSNSAAKETKALTMLADAECAHAPTYFHDIVKRPDSLMTGSEHYIFMYKLPGVTLKEIYDSFSLAQRTNVRLRLAQAVRKVWDCGVDNGGHHLGNVIWDAETSKCYIIDFERATFGDFTDYEVDVNEWGCYA